MADNPRRRQVVVEQERAHSSRKSLEIYSRLSISEAQEEYNNVIGRFPI